MFSKVGIFSGQAADTGLLLDLYPNTLGDSWSTKKIKSSFTGNVIEIERDDTTTSFYQFDGEELPTSDIATFVGLGDGKCLFLESQANGTDLEDSVAPLLYSSGTLNQIGTKPAFLFDGSTSCLFSWNDTTAPANYQSFDDNITIIAKISANSLSASSTLWRSGQTIAELRTNLGSSNPNFGVPFNFGLNSAKLFLGVAEDGGNDGLSSTSSLSVSTDHVVAVSINSNTVKMFIDGVLDSTQTITSATGDRSIGTSDSTFSVGARSRDGGQIDRNYFDGLLSDIYVYGSTLDDADIIAISGLI